MEHMEEMWYLKLFLIIFDHQIAKGRITFFCHKNKKTYTISYSNY